MEVIKIVLQLIIAVGIFNVWFLRFGKSSEWRGGSASNMKEEFATYGLPEWSVYVIGFLKVTFAVLLIAGLFAPVVTDPAAIGMAVLMAGAMVMHFKVGDPPKKALPSFLMLIMSVAVIAL